MRQGNRTKGFTLVELLIVIAIIGILAAVLIPNLMNARRVAVDRAAQGFVQNVYTAANAYMAENVRASTTDTAALATACASGGVTGDIEFGSYTVSEPSFATSACSVSGANNEITVSITYSGGALTTASIP